MLRYFSRIWGLVFSLLDLQRALGVQDLAVDVLVDGRSPLGSVVAW